MRNLPGYQGADKGEPSNLGGFDATQIGGFYTKDGINHMVAQKTVVVPGQDGLFVIKLTADGTEDQADPLMEATAAIDDQTTITSPDPAQARDSCEASAICSGVGRTPV